MKLRVRAKDLKNSIDKANVSVNKNNQNNQLKGIFLEASESLLTIRSTNINTGYENKISADIENKGKTVVLGEVLVRVFSSISFTDNAYCEMSLQENVLKIKVDKHFFEIKTLASEDFPLLPVVEGISFEIDIQSFIYGFKSCVYAVAKTDIKPEIGGVYVYSEDGILTFVGTDSYRLAEKKQENKNIANTQFIMPEKNAKDFIRLFDTEQGMGTVHLSKNSLSFTLESQIFITRLIQGNFPNYRQIIPSSPISQAVFLKSDMQKALKIASFFSDKTEQIVLSAEDGLIKIHAENLDIGNTTEQLQASLKNEAFSIKINSRYFEEFLNNTPSTSLIIKFTAQNKPIIIQGIEDAFYTYLIMPSYK